jgi:hypothetical protein
MLATNYFMSWGIESVLGHDGLMPTKYQRLARYRIPAWGETQTAALESPWFVDLLDLFGARWILVRREQRAPVAARYRYATSFADLDLFENPGALPRVFACAPEEEPPVAQGEVPGPPLRVAEDSGRAWLVDREFTARGIEPEHYEPGRVRAIVDTDRERLVLHGCNATSGWVALVDGHERPLRTVREALGGVVVPAGRHTVEFVYRPPAWPQGVKASGVSAVLFLLLLGVFRQRRSVA